MKGLCFLTSFLILMSCSCQNKITEYKAGTLFATAILKPRSNSNIKGKVWFYNTKDGLQILGKVYAAEQGFHGLHIHEKGDCSAQDASSAGGHYNPTNAPHGFADPKKYHIGDLGNIIVGQNNEGLINLSIPKNRFSKDFLDYKKIIGKAIILHSKVDDLQSQPSGNAGQRIGCGKIVKASS